MTRRTPGRGPRAAMALALALAAGACVHERITESRSSSLLVVERITAAPGGTGVDPTITALRSDVQTGRGVFDDLGRVTTSLALKDPGTPEAPTVPSRSNFVTVNRYRVEYRRTDGRNTPGVDVPFPFDSGVTFTTPDGAVSAEFVLVRASAKLEPPLAALAGGGGALVINTIADITFSGHDQTGAEVSARGSIAVHFGDWQDGDAPPPDAGNGNGEGDGPPGEDE